MEIADFASHLHSSIHQRISGNSS